MQQIHIVNHTYNASSNNNSNNNSNCFAMSFATAAAVLVALASRPLSEDLVARAVRDDGQLPERAPRRLRHCSGERLAHVFCDVVLHGRVYFDQDVR